MWKWRRLPESSLERTRLVALAIGGLAVLSEMAQIGNALRSPEYLRLSAACIVLTLLVLLGVYVRGRTSWWSAAVLPVLVTIGGAGLKDPVAGTALALATTVVLSLYGSTRLWAARVIGAVIAVPAAVAISPDSGGRLMTWNSPTVLGVLPQILLMAVLTRGIYLSLRRQERTAARESLLARAGHAMLGVTDVEQVREVGRRTADGLVALSPGVVLLVLRRSRGGLVVSTAAGVLDGVRGSRLELRAVAEPARLTELVPGMREWHVDALGADPETAEVYIAVGGRRRVHTDVVDSFRNLSHQVVLAENGCHAHAELEHRAHHDELTALPTRAKLQGAIADALNRNPGGTVALLNIDLDDFKQVNDGYGHAAGDELLVAVASRLMTAVRGRGLAARYGGDEFALLLTGLSGRHEADEIAAEVRAHLTAPMALTVATVTVGASVGVAMAEPGITVTELTNRADAAMYTAKTAGKSRSAA
ncbi:GGDEF domain-containing protein [Actinoplanes sp. NPDC026619]|uniref:GGDEF domain-containing protein n=1 Tax=Actinoplanes sp. NPDC026619 TaxID=3155798 RepID=UPI0033DB5301